MKISEYWLGAFTGIIGCILGSILYDFLFK